MPKQIKTILMGMVVLVAAVCIFRSDSASALNCTWTGSQSSSATIAQNWVNCGGNVPQDLDSIIFPSGIANHMVNYDIVDDGRVFSALQFTDNGFTVTGGEIRAGSILSSASAGADNTISAALRMIGAGPSITTSDAGNLVISGTLYSNNTTQIGPSTGSTITLSGLVGGPGGITKDGNGALILGNNNYYYGPTSIFGPATINGNQSASDVTVLSGGTLKGTGTVGVLGAQLGSHLAPGNSPGCLNAGATTLSAGSTFDVEIAGSTVCSGYDQLNVTGTVNVTGATLNAALLSGFVPTNGQQFVIINNDLADAVTGVFTGLPEGATLTIGGQPFSISYIGGDGNDVTLKATSTTGPPAGNITGPPADPKVPGAPKTGFGLLGANPLAPLGASILAGVALYFTALRWKPESRADQQ